jgi:ElaB/YqjD/DUF883 family membrane-anchored ribosome-binding protein
MSSEAALDRDSRNGEPVNSTIAEALRAAAGALTNPGAAGSNRGLGGLGNRAAEVLNRSADYVGEIDLERLKEGVANQVRRNPARSLLIAGAAGLILGALLRRR